MTAKKGAEGKPRLVLRETKLVDAIRKKFGASAALIPNEHDADSKVTGYIPTGLDVLDNYVVGCGGLPEGKISEVFADEGAGKSSLMLTSFASVQKLGGVAQLYDPELTFDDQRAEVLGVDVSRLVLEQPQHIEELFEMIKLTLRTHDGKVPLLSGWDSIASTNTKAGLVAEAGRARVGEVPLLMSQELKKILALLHGKRAHLMMINQTRQKIGGFGANVTTPGGGAPKFYAWLRLWIMGGKAVKGLRPGGKKKEHVGKIVTIFGAKNKQVPPGRSARVLFRYLSGYDNEWSTIQFAVEDGRIEPPEVRDRAAYELACAKLGWAPAPPRTAAEQAAIETIETGDDDDD